MRAVVVGCGQIGGKADEPRAGLPPVTHAGAYAANPNFETVACVEPDGERRASFAAHWRIENAFADVAALLESGLAFDVASVCAPTPSHGAILEQLLASPAHAVFAEKPLCSRVEESARIVAAYARAGKPLLVNFTRRWNTSFVALKSQIDLGHWGRPLSAVGFYTKGIRHNGSHLIDLLQFLLGTLAVVAVTGRRADYWPDDPSVDAVLATAEGACVHLCAGDARHFAVFEATLLFERGAVSIEAGGRILRTRRVEADRLHAGQTSLAAGATEESDWTNQFLRALDGLADCVDFGTPAASTGSTALATQALCDELAEAELSSRPKSPTAKEPIA